MVPTTTGTFVSAVHAVAWRAHLGPNMMTFSPPRIDVVKREDKEEKLVEFIRSVVAGKPAAASIDVTVVSRSAESPVMRALSPALLAEQATARCQPRIILAMADPDSPPAPGLARADFRWARQARLLDAHEQLVIDGAASWVGDCMRRDPDKRDAYECFAGECGETARFGALSFERLWALAEPVSFAAVGTTVETAPELPSMVAAGLASDPVQASTTVAGTGH